MVATLNLNLGNDHRSFQYRKGSRDEVAITHVLSNSAYNFRRLGRGEELVGLYERLSGAGAVPLIVDVGANIGASTLYFAHSFPQARVVALEADQSNFDLLAANTDGLSVELLRATIGSSAIVLGAKEPCDDLSVRLVASQGREEASGVPRLTMNEIFEKYAQESEPFIVKLDLDSCDDDLFFSNAEWVERAPIIIIDLHDGLIPGSENIRKFVDYISGCNRDFVYLQDSIFSIGRDLVAA